MVDTTKGEPQENREPAPRRIGGRGLLWGLLVVVIAFFIGFFWQFYQATTVRRVLSETEQELLVERMRVQLASASIAAQAGRFEEARREMSTFFNRIHHERWALPDEMRPLVNEFLAMRDDVVTGLARAQPQYADVVMGMRERFEEAMPEDPAPGPGVETRPPQETTAPAQEPAPQF